jgi:hypothetical protein
VTGILDALSEAAARGGVQVTIITNAHMPPPITLKWQFEEKWWGVIGKTRACGLELVVVDRDGDDSDWELRHGKAVLAHGRDHGNQPYYHFDACLLAAETALRAEVQRRKDAVRARKAGAA